MVELLPAIEGPEEDEVEYSLPWQWEARPYQRRAWNYFVDGGKRGVLVWPRRHGKDEFALRLALSMAMQRPANYWHMLPQASQARKAIWTAVNPHTGRRRIDEAFPEFLVKKRLDTDMSITFINGSTWQVVGSDNYSSLLSSQPAGIVFSEWARADPTAWPYLQPMLEENGGWALFVSTVFGANHFHRLYQHAQAQDSWLADLRRAPGLGVFSDAKLAEIRDELIALNGTDEGDAIYRMDYLSDWVAATPGSYYGSLMTSAREEGRIGEVPHTPGYPVHTYWDLGVRDQTAIWFVQRIGPWTHWIDYYEHRSAGADHYAMVLADRARECGYVYGRHVGPHDARQRHFGSVGAQSTIQLLGSLGVEMIVQGAVSLTDAGYRRDGIAALRRLLPRSRFDDVRCERGLQCLSEYHREWDAGRSIFLDVPYHNWASDGADAARVCAMDIGDASQAGMADLQTTAIMAERRREQLRRTVDWRAM